MSVASPLLLDRDSLYLSILTERRAQYLYSLKSFIHGAWHLVEPVEPLCWNWHLDELCEILESVSAGDIKRLIVNIPPGCMKSLCVNVFWPAWEWAKRPDLRYITFSYSDVNTIRDNIRVRNIVSSEWYQSLFWQHPDQSPKVDFASDQNAKVKFETTSKGFRIASSVGGAGLGEHPDRIIIDDPTKAEEAKSEIIRDGVNSWMQSTVSTRINRDPAIVVIMQRLHEEDLTGFLLQKGGWTHVLFPMRYHIPVEQEDGTWRNGWDCPCHRTNADILDQRIEEGELLWPEKFPEQKVYEDLELIMGPIEASGQLDQRPSPEGGTLIQRDWFEIVDSVPAGAIKCRGWDTADTDIKTKKAKKADWTTGTLVARHKGTFYIEHNIRVKTNPAGVDNLILSTAVSDGKRVKIREGSGSGKATTDARLQSLAGWDYDTQPETEPKPERAKPFRQQAQGGNVKIVRGDWNNAYLDVVCSFPVGKHDDDVDSTVNAFNALCDKPKPRIRLSLG